MTHETNAPVVKTTPVSELNNAIHTNKPIDFFIIRKPTSVM